VAGAHAGGQCAYHPIRRTYDRFLPVYPHRMKPPAWIICPDCGGTCSVAGFLPPDEDLAPGDVVAYRCPDCWDRWDVVLSEDDAD
jgi:hypothetical protein